LRVAAKRRGEGLLRHGWTKTLTRLAEFIIGPRFARLRGLATLSPKEGDTEHLANRVLIRELVLAVSRLEP
jgi:hypothetical protein